MEVVTPAATTSLQTHVHRFDSDTDIDDKTTSVELPANFRIARARVKLAGELGY